MLKLVGAFGTILLKRLKEMYMSFEKNIPFLNKSIFYLVKKQNWRPQTSEWGKGHYCRGLYLSTFTGRVIWQNLQNVHAFSPAIILIRCQKAFKMFMLLVQQLYL